MFSNILFSMGQGDGVMSQITRTLLRPPVPIIIKYIIKIVSNFCSNFYNSETCKFIRLCR